jgi:transcription antitermination factor NusG
MKDVALPLFPGYVFSHFDVHRRLPILTIPGVINIVGAGRSPVAVDEAELDAIRSLVASGRPVTPWPFLQIGDRVLIERGALQGIEGILVQTRSRSRLVVSVGLLQRSVSVEIDDDAVRPISSLQSPSSLCTAITMRTPPIEASPRAGIEIAKRLVR